jgi:cytochrome c oxidase subunit 3
MKEGNGRATVALPVGMWAVGATVVMLFTAFASTYVVRRGAADWVRVDLPPALWAGVFVLVATVLPVESARRAARRGDAVAAGRAVAAALFLGVLFIAAQAAAWAQMRAAGLFLQTNPHAAYLYVLSAVHAVHVGAGWIALLAVGLGVRAASDRWRGRVAFCAFYWHVLAAVWSGIFAMMAVL